MTTNTSDNDFIYFGDRNDSLQLSYGGNDTIYMGAGNDTVIAYSITSGTSMSFALDQNDSLNGGEGEDELIIQNHVDTTASMFAGVSNFEKITFVAAENIVTISSINNLPDVWVTTAGLMGMGSVTLELDTHDTLSLRSTGNVYVKSVNVLGNKSATANVQLHAVDESISLGSTVHLSDENSRYNLIGSKYDDTFVLHGDIFTNSDVLKGNGGFDTVVFNDNVSINMSEFSQLKNIDEFYFAQGANELKISKGSVNSMADAEGKVVLRYDADINTLQLARLQYDDVADLYLKGDSLVTLKAHFSKDDDVAVHLADESSSYNIIGSAYSDKVFIHGNILSDDDVLDGKEGDDELIFMDDISISSKDLVNVSSYEKISFEDDVVLTIDKDMLDEIIDGNLEIDAKGSQNTLLYGLDYEMIRGSGNNLHEVKSSYESINNNYFDDFDKIDFVVMMNMWDIEVETYEVTVGENTDIHANVLEGTIDDDKLIITNPYNMGLLPQLMNGGDGYDTVEIIGGVGENGVISKIEWNANTLNYILGKIKEANFEQLIVTNEAKLWIDSNSIVSVGDTRDGVSIPLEILAKGEGNKAYIEAGASTDHLSGFELHYESEFDISVNYDAAVDSGNIIYGSGSDDVITVNFNTPYDPNVNNNLTRNASYLNNLSNIINTMGGGQDHIIIESKLNLDSYSNTQPLLPSLGVEKITLKDVELSNIQVLNSINQEGLEINFEKIYLLNQESINITNNNVFEIITGTVNDNVFSIEMSDDQLSILENIGSMQGGDGNDTLVLKSDTSYYLGSMNKISGFETIRFDYGAEAIVLDSNRISSNADEYGRMVIEYAGDIDLMRLENLQHDDVSTKNQLWLRSISDDIHTVTLSAGSNDERFRDNDVAIHLGDINSKYNILGSDYADHIYIYGNILSSDDHLSGGSGVDRIIFVGEDVSLNDDMFTNVIEFEQLSINLNEGVTTDLGDSSSMIPTGATANLDISAIDYLLTGTAYNDTVTIQGGIISSEDTLDGGDGEDVLSFASSVDINLSDMINVVNFEKIKFKSSSTVHLDTALDMDLEFSNNDDTVHLDISYENNSSQIAIDGKEGDDKLFLNSEVESNIFFGGIRNFEHVVVSDSSIVEIKIDDDSNLSNVSFSAEEGSRLIFSNNLYSGERINLSLEGGEIQLEAGSAGMTYNLSSTNNNTSVYIDGHDSLDLKLGKNIDVIHIYNVHHYVSPYTLDGTGSENTVIFDDEITFFGGYAYLSKISEALTNIENIKFDGSVDILINSSFNSESGLKSIKGSDFDDSIYFRNGSESQLSYSDLEFLKYTDLGEGKDRVIFDIDINQMDITGHGIINLIKQASGVEEWVFSNDTQLEFSSTDNDIQGLHLVSDNDNNLIILVDDNTKYDFQFTGKVTINNTADITLTDSSEIHLFRDDESDVFNISGSHGDDVVYFERAANMRNLSGKLSNDDTWEPDRVAGGKGYDTLIIEKKAQLDENQTQAFNNAVINFEEIIFSESDLNRLVFSENDYWNTSFVAKNDAKLTLHYDLDSSIVAEVATYGNVHLVGSGQIQLNTKSLDEKIGSEVHLHDAHDFKIFGSSGQDTVYLNGQYNSSHGNILKDQWDHYNETPDTLYLSDESVITMHNVEGFEKIVGGNIILTPDTLGDDLYNGVILIENSTLNGIYVDGTETDEERTGVSPNGHDFLGWSPNTGDILFGGDWEPYSLNHTIHLKSINTVVYTDATVQLMQHGLGLGLGSSVILDGNEDSNYKIKGSDLNDIFIVNSGEVFNTLSAGYLKGNNGYDTIQIHDNVNLKASELRDYTNSIEEWNFNVGQSTLNFDDYNYDSKNSLIRVNDNAELFISVGHDYSEKVELKTQGKAVLIGTTEVILQAVPEKGIGSEIFLLLDQFIHEDYGYNITGSKENDSINVFGYAHESQLYTNESQFYGSINASSIDAGEGFDSLLFYDINSSSQGQSILNGIETINFSNINDDVFKNFDRIDISGSGANEIYLEVNDLIKLTGSNNTLYVSGDQSDKVTLNDSNDLTVHAITHQYFGIEKEGISYNGYTYSSNNEEFSIYANINFDYNTSIVSPFEDQFIYIGNQIHSVDLIDAGDGFDTIILDSQLEFLTLTGSIFNNIERIDLRQIGSQTLKINEQNIVDITDNSNTLYIHGGVDDVVDLSDLVLTETGDSELRDGILYNKFLSESDTVILYLQQDIQKSRQNFTSNDDLIHVNSSVDNSYRLNGDDGFDQVKVHAEFLNMTELDDNVITNVERLALESSNAQTLTMNIQDIISLTDHNNTLYIRGGSEDALILEDLMPNDIIAWNEDIITGSGNQLVNSSRMELKSGQETVTLYYEQSLQTSFDINKTGTVNDDMLLVNSAITVDDRFNGGDGFDIINVLGESIDMRDLGSEVIVDVEQIDFRGYGDQIFTLTQQDLLDMTDSSHTLFIRGDSQFGNFDTVHMVGEMLTYLGTAMYYGVNYDAYSKGEATLYVEEGMQVNSDTKSQVASNTSWIGADHINDTVFLLNTLVDGDVLDGLGGFDTVVVSSGMDQSNLNSFHNIEKIDLSETDSHTLSLNHQALVDATDTSNALYVLGDSSSTVEVVEVNAGNNIQTGIVTHEGVLYNTYELRSEALPTATLYVSLDIGTITNTAPILGLNDEHTGTIGNDTIGLPENYAGSLDGDVGFDKVVLSHSLDMTLDESPTITNIEEIDLSSGSGNRFKLSDTNLRDMTDDSNALYVSGNPGNTVEFMGNVQRFSSFYRNEILYHTYVANENSVEEAYTIYVQNEVNFFSSGDDVIYVTSVENSDRIEAGAGRDTLVLTSGTSLNMTQLNQNVITDIEHIDLGFSGQEYLVLTPQDIKDMISDDSELYVSGGGGSGGDFVEFFGDLTFTSSTKTDDANPKPVYDIYDYDPHAVATELLYIQQGVLLKAHVDSQFSGSKFDENIYIEELVSSDSINGADGFDKLIIKGDMLNMINIGSNVLSNIEMIELTRDGNKKLQLNGHGLNNVTDTDNELYVRGDEGDFVEFFGDMLFSANNGKYLHYHVNNINNNGEQSSLHIENLMLLKAHVDRTFSGSGFDDNIYINELVTDASINGGEGFDKLIMKGDELDMTILDSDVLLNIEMIELTRDNGVNKELKLNAQDVLDMTDDDNVLYVRGGDGSSVDIDTSFSQSEGVTLNGIEYNTYSSLINFKSVTLYTEHHLSVI